LICFSGGGVDLGEVAGERLEDLVGGFGPTEGRGLSFQSSIHAAMSSSRALTATADKFVGEQTEPTFDLIHPT
jgi:hypothetical protein